MRWVRRLGLLGLVFVVLTAGANAMVFAGGRSAAEAAVDKAPVAIILGAGLRPDGSPSLMLDDRLAVAAELYREGRVEKLLASGDHGRDEYDEVSAMRGRLVELGVPDEDIFTDHAGFDTWSSMVRARKVFGAEEVIVITQRFHLARALWLARRAGLDADGMAADRHGYGEKGRIAAVREIFARVKSVGEVVVQRPPRHLGPKIDLSGDGRVTLG